MRSMVGFVHEYHVQGMSSEMVHRYTLDALTLLCNRLHFLFQPLLACLFNSWNLTLILLDQEYSYYFSTFRYFSSEVSVADTVEGLL